MNASTQGAIPRPDTASDDAVRLDSVVKIYGKNSTGVRALDGISTAIARGSFTAIMGPSGSGKSTFLHCAAGLDHPTSGSVQLGSTDIGGMKENRLTQLRRQRIGFVFQAFNLVGSLTVRQNVELPLRMAGRRADKGWLAQTLRRVGLEGYEKRRPAQLSGGQQQRVAIARALITEPDVVFGDEPTGALDTVTAKDVLSLLRLCVSQTQQTVVMVTHDPVAASYADSVLFLADGRIVDQMASPTAERVAERMTHLGAWA